MASSDRLNPQQLAMFIPAGELMDYQKYSVHSFEHFEGESTKDVQARKLEESKQPWSVAGERTHGGGIWNSLSTGAQVQKPIHLVSNPDLREQEDEELIHLRKGHNPIGLIRDGMHRIAAAADIDPKMEVPVEWKRNVHWEHDRTGRPADPPPPTPPPDPWDTDDHKWIKGSYNANIGHDLHQYRTTRDEETGQIGTEWEHYGPTAENELEQTGKPIKEDVLARLRDPNDFGDY
ncbi:hypothetical protein CMI47_06610 [Candidatus Pacearchaeota archaeon]|nr:hypothetical protein [Candidatus Pacearchaeota archaeon]